MSAPRHAQLGDAASNLPFLLPSIFLMKSALILSFTGFQSQAINSHIFSLRQDILPLHFIKYAFFFYLFTYLGIFNFVQSFEINSKLTRVKSRLNYLFQFGIMYHLVTDNLRSLRWTSKSMLELKN
jgi:hypothetical protein